MSFGRISLAKRGEKSDRASISSDGMEVAVKLEKDFAADLRALRDAVRLDLRLDFFLTGSLDRWLKGFGTIVSSESLAEEGRRGWSSHCSVGGEMISFSAFIALARRLRNEGVEGPLLIVDVVLRAGSRDGVVDAIESLDTERDDSKSPSFSSSISARLSSSSSSAGSSRISNGVRNGSDDGEVPSSLHSCINSSIVTLLLC